MTLRGRSRLLASGASIVCVVVLAACGRVVQIGTRTEQAVDASPSPSSTACPEGVAATATSNECPGDSERDEPSEPAATIVPGGLADASAIILPPSAATDGGVPPNVNCGERAGAGPRWTFDDSAQGWQQSGASGASLTWDAAVGSAAPGSLLVESTTDVADDVFVFTPAATADMSGVVLTLDARVEIGAGVSLKVFAQSGSSYAWADGGIVSVAAGEWVCLALALDDPTFAVSGFDASQVRRVGVAIHGARYRVHLDDVAH